MHFSQIAQKHGLMGRRVTKMQRTDAGDGYYTPEPVGGTSTYQYDNLHRLTYEYFTAQASTIIHDFGYQYYHDSVGNRTKHRFYNWEHDWYYDEYDEQWYPIGDWEDTTYQFSSRNELTKTTDWQDNVTTFTYDLRGNLTKRGATEYYWDSADHMTKVVKDSVATQYKYDIMGRRVAKKIADGAWRWFFYDGLKIIAEGTSTTARSYYTQGPGVIGGVICADGTSFYHYDRLGTLIATSNEYGEVSQTFPTADAFSGGAIFTGKQYDPDAGLYYFNARWYDPTTGRFVSADPLDFREESQYSFGHNNPITWIDPSGELTILAAGVGVIACEVVAFPIVAKIQKARHNSAMCDVAEYWALEFCTNTCMKKLEDKPTVEREWEACKKWLRRAQQWCPEKRYAVIMAAIQIPGASLGMPPPTSALGCKCMIARKCVLGL